jgi:hypothetical protein
MKQLDFTLSLIDKLSRPLKQAQGNVTGFAEKSKEAFMQIGGGVLALAGKRFFHLTTTAQHHKRICAVTLR